jgi:hypothetical protein
MPEIQKELNFHHPHPFEIPKNCFFFALSGI